jgi:hypothetical protein
MRRTGPKPDQSVGILPSRLRDRPDDPDSTTLITYPMTVAAQVRWQNRLMAQTRWQWLRSIGTGHLILIARFATLDAWSI